MGRLERDRSVGIYPLASRNVDLLSGHSFNAPIASLRAGTLKLADADDALRFEADLPADARQPTWMRDTVLAVEGGLAGGVSPGFRVPPASVVANAEELISEPGNPGVQIRQVNQAVLYEISIVSRPAYAETVVEAREDESTATPTRARHRIAVHAGRDIERRKSGSPKRRDGQVRRRQHRLHREMARCRGASRRLRPHARLYALHRDLGGLHSAPAVEPVPQREGEPKPEMNGVKKSDGAILPSKRANTGVQIPAESVEGRASTKGNPRSESTRRTQRRESVSQAAERIRQAFAVKYPR